MFDLVTLSKRKHQRSSTAIAGFKSNSFLSYPFESLQFCHLLWYLMCILFFGTIALHVWHFKCYFISHLFYRMSLNKSLSLLFLEESHPFFLSLLWYQFLTFIYVAYILGIKGCTPETDDFYLVMHKALGMPDLYCDIWVVDRRANRLEGLFVVVQVNFPHTVMKKAPAIFQKEEAVHSLSTHFCAKDNEPQQGEGLSYRAEGLHGWCASFWGTPPKDAQPCKCTVLHPPHSPSSVSV